MPQHSRHIWWVLTGFAAITLVLTWPIGAQLGSAVVDFGDPLLNSWILSWEAHSLGSLGKVSFFNTNIFHPHRNTLAYSEMLIPQLILAAPVNWWSGNPVLAHNLVLVASFIATAMGAYLLAFHFTHNVSASFAAGLIFAYSPFMFDHLAHVQVILAAGIPLAFLFLHRFFNGQRTADAVYFALSYAFQVLANAYYAVYLSFFAGLYLIIEVLRRKLWRQRRFWVQMGVAAAIITIMVAPFYLHYFQLKREMGFSRYMSPPAPVFTYLAAPATNHLYGELTRSLGRSEARRLPGLMAMALTVVALRSRVARRKSGVRRSPAPATAQRQSWRWVRILDGAIALVAILIALQALGLAIDTQLGPIRFSVRSMGNPSLILLILLTLRWWMSRRWPGRLPPVDLRLSRPTYPIILLAAFVLSLGTAPYLFLYRWVPGFGSLRAVPRIHVMFMLAVAILAAEGMVIVLRKLPRSRRRMAVAAILLVIGIEYLSAPIPVVSAPRQSEFPAVQQWLAEREDDPVVVAYPLRRLRDEWLRVYYSTAHRRRMINGYSGYIPPLYEELRSKERQIPNQEVVGDLQALGVDLVLIETAKLKARRLERLRSRLARLQGLELIEDFDGTLVYRVLRPFPDPPAPEGRERSTVPLDPESTTLRASSNSDLLSSALDGDRRTFWRAPMVPGEWIEVQWEELAPVVAVELEISGSPLDYPRGVQIETSTDGRQWQTSLTRSDYHPPILGFLQPNDFRLRFEFADTGARFVRVTQTGASSDHPWTVVELSVLRSSP